MINLDMMCWCRFKDGTLKKMTICIILHQFCFKAYFVKIEKFG